jgi:hypothetical protein
MIIDRRRRKLLVLADVEGTAVASAPSGAAAAHVQYKTGELSPVTALQPSSTLCIEQLHEWNLSSLTSNTGLARIEPWPSLTLPSCDFAVCKFGLRICDV